MSLQRTILACGLALFGAFGTGCFTSDETPAEPEFEGLEAYDSQPMYNNRTQYYGATEYTFTSLCESGAETVVGRSSDAEAVWFDVDVEIGIGDEPDTVTIAPEQDEGWSALVSVSCEGPSGANSQREFFNFCHMGPCSEYEK